jgi:hypothetical protein
MKNNIKHMEMLVGVSGYCQLSCQEDLRQTILLAN